MKTSMRYLGFIAAVVATSAFAAEEAPLPKISENNTAAVAPSPAVTQQLNAALPKYDPQAAAVAAEAAKANAEPRPGDPVKVTTREDIARAANPSDADLLVLPKMTVKQKPRPRLTEDVIYKDKKDFGAIFAKQNYTQLDQALNKYTLPLFGTSLEARAYDDYMRQKNAQAKEDVNSLAKAVEQTDAAEAKALRDAINK